MNVQIQSFIDKFNGFIPERLFVKLLQKSIDGISCCEVPDSAIERIEKAKMKYNMQAERMSACADRNNHGLELEKNGKIDEAIAVYEDNIADGYPATHSFERLMVLYRKSKDYKQEKRVIKRACTVFKKHPSLFNKYMSRLEKVETLINKRK